MHLNLIAYFFFYIRILGQLHASYCNSFTLVWLHAFKVQLVTSNICHFQYMLIYLRPTQTNGSRSERRGKKAERK